MSLLTKIVKVKWRKDNKDWYIKKGYTFTKISDEFEIQTIDLTNGSAIYVDVKCDCENCKNSYLKPMKWQVYIKGLKEDGKYYCRKCSCKLYGVESARRARLKKGKSFEQWCYDNLDKNESEYVLNRWDYELNNKKPNQIGYGAKTKHWFKCLEHLEHKSELKCINNFTSGQKNSLSCNKCNSFQQWCYDNLSKEEADNILLRWDYEKNIDENGNMIKPSDVSYASGSFNKKGYWFKCNNHIEHNSELKNINSFTSGHNGSIHCNACNSFAQWGIDNIGEDFLEKYWDYDKNVINPWQIDKSSAKSIYIKCQNKNKLYHQNYNTSCHHFINGNRCPFCHGLKVHPLDSLGQYIINSYGEEFLSKVWSEKNIKTVFEYMPKSQNKVWWKCQENEHEDYFRIIGGSNFCEFRCPNCQCSKGETRINKWLKENAFTQNKDYILQKEFDGLLGLGDGNLSYDFYLLSHNLLIEYQGEQHDHPVDFYGEGKKKSEAQFKIQQEHDRRKKEYTDDNNIELLEIWYWDFDNIESILDSKINKFL